MAKIDISLLCKEQVKECASSRNGITIGIPKEDQGEEKRLALTPEAVAILTLRGHRIVVERGAGEGVNYSDMEYSEAGALLAESPEDVFACDVVLKIAPPLPEEILMMHPRSTLFSMMYPDTFLPQSIDLLLERKITAIAYDMLLDDDGEHSIINAIAEIEGTAAVAIASNLMSNVSGGKGVLLGGMPGNAPTEIVILGAGYAGIAAARAAMGMGALVKVFDNNINLLRNFQKHLGHNTFTSTYHPNVLHNAFVSADVVIGAVPCVKGTIDPLISEELVRCMKKGALIVDLQMHHGGCFETTSMQIARKPEYFKVFGVLHYCKPSISSLYARTTAISVSNIFLPLLISTGDLGGINAQIKVNSNFRSGVYIYGGRCVCPYVANYFNKPFSDLALLFPGY
ncbi:MAG: alanine dehydrogenase [Bacteroidales bacterium]|nr:alanine dehydrogenase [Bacteroidales bacterium]